jgi:hypothetical protein
VSESLGLRKEGWGLDSWACGRTAEAWTPGSETGGPGSGLREEG